MQKHEQAQAKKYEAMAGIIKEGEEVVLEAGSLTRDVGLHGRWSITKLPLMAALSNLSGRQATGMSPDCCRLH